LIEHKKRLHGGVLSDIEANASDGVSYASPRQHEDQDQHSKSASVERSSPHEDQAQLLHGVTSNATSNDPEKLKTQLRMLRMKRNELQEALVELDTDIMETERSLLDAICA
jgi:hypothetical protein